MGGGISQVWGGHQPSMGRGSSTNYGGGISQVWVVINQVWGGSSTNYGGWYHHVTMGGHQASMGRGVINQLWGGAISQVWGGHQPSMGRGVISQVWGGVINQVWVGGSSTNYGGWYHHVAMGDRGIYFPTSMYRNSKSRELL